MDYKFGYCTNVHAGTSLEQAQRNLETIACEVRRQVHPSGRLPVGLWLAENAAKQLNEGAHLARFGDWLCEHGLKPYTLNGFPQGDFHQAVVKHLVYLPTWLDESRLTYTQLLADCLSCLLEKDQSGSISTLPLGWPVENWRREEFARAGQQLQRLAQHLRRLDESSGHCIVVAIEPEPGCVLDTATDIIEFLSRYVFDHQPQWLRKYITVCHDICHSAVMFEEQTTALQAYRNADIRIGKVQVSSAIEAPWAKAHDAPARAAMLEQLRDFNEPRYLHQTTRPISRPMLDGTVDRQIEMAEDLHFALDQWSIGHDELAWRIHFHVPIYVERFGHLEATRSDIQKAVACIQQLSNSSVEGLPWFTGDYEVETYAWGVLPAELKVASLADGIAQELKYFENLFQNQDASSQPPTCAKVPQSE